MLLTDADRADDGGNGCRDAAAGGCDAADGDGGDSDDNFFFNYFFLNYFLLPQFVACNTDIFFFFFLTETFKRCM